MIGMIRYNFQNVLFILKLLWKLDTKYIVGEKLTVIQKNHNFLYSFLHVKPVHKDYRTALEN